MVNTCAIKKAVKIATTKQDVLRRFALTQDNIDIEDVKVDEFCLSVKRLSSFEKRYGCSQRQNLII